MLTSDTGGPKGPLVREYNTREISEIKQESALQGRLFMRLLVIGSANTQAARPRQENRMDARIGQVVREGKTIFYAFIGGRELSNMVESADVADIGAALEGKSPAAKVATKKPSTYLKYAVTVTPKYQYGTGEYSHNAYTVEVLAKSRAEAIKEARRDYNENSSFPGDTATYTAKRA